MAFRVLFGAVLGLLLAVPAQAGLVTIDHFTNAANSDGLGTRVTSALVTVNAAQSNASMLAVGTTGSSITYNFLPTPLVVAPKFRINGRNNQSNLAETGELTVTISYTNGGPAQQTLTQTLQGNQGGVNSDYYFDFTSLVGPSITLDDLKLDWNLPSSGSGARELIIDFIDVEEVPEPATLALIGLASSGGGIAAFRRRRKAAASKK